MALGLVLPLAVVGCEGQSEVSGDNYTIYVHDALFPGGGTDAEVFGTLATRDGCVLLENEEIEMAFPVIWPRGTSITSEDPLTLELPSGEALAVGQAVSGGGGYPKSWSDWVEVDIPAACVPETGEVAMFNADDDPSVVE